MKHCKVCRLVLACLLSMFLYTETSTAKTQSDIVERWEDFSQEKINTAPQQLSNIVIFRSEALKGTAVNIFIDGEYHTSLLPGAYTQTTVCPGKHRIKPAYTNVQTRYEEKQMEGQSIDLQSGEVSYFQVIVDTKNTLKVQRLSPAQSASLRKKYLPKQNHTISRLSKKECPNIQNPSKKAGIK